LDEWARNLWSSTAETWLNSFSSSDTSDGKLHVRGVEGIGLLLLLHAAEVARSEAREGHLWAVMRKTFLPSTEGMLFSQGNPTQWYKDALQLAAVRFNLRHVFGVAGVQYYYETVYLQFGFTRRGLSQLPHWLAGFQPSEAIQMLLGWYGNLGSPTFQNLWRHLRDYRRNNLTENQLRQALAQSPWIVDEWIDEVIRRAKEKLELGTATEGHASASNKVALPFFDTPRLRWDPPSELNFYCRLINLAEFDLSKEQYDIVSGGTVVGHLFRQPDETYVLDTKDRQKELVTLSGALPRHIIQLVDDSGEVLASQSIDLWDADEEVNLFEMPSGRRVKDAWRDPLSVRRSYALMTSQDLEVRPPLQIWQLLVEQHKRLSLLAMNWPANLQVLLAGQELWTPNLAAAQRPAPVEPAWATPVYLKTEGTPKLRFGQKLRIVVHGLEARIEVKYVRMGGRPCTFSVEGTGVRVEAGVVTPAMAAHGFSFTLCLRRLNEQTLLHRTLFADVFGVARFGAEGWGSVPLGGVVTVDDARSSVYRLFLPADAAEKRFEDLALFEGMTFTSRLHRTPRGFGTLGGFGAPLRVFPNPFNEETPLLTIARAVISPGVISKVELEGPGMVRVLLRRPIELGSHHQVVCWSPGGTPTIQTSDRVLVEEPGVWWIERDGDGSGLVVVAVAFDGRLLGSAWPPDIGTAWVPSTGATMLTRGTAGLIRWMHLPLLDSALLPAMRAFAHRYPADTLAAWLHDEEPWGGLVCDAITEEWLAAVL
jgi:hypothetical protein